MELVKSTWIGQAWNPLKATDCVGMKHVKNYGRTDKMPNNRQKFAKLDNRSGVDGEDGEQLEGQEGADNPGEGEGDGDDGDSSKKPEPKYTDDDLDAAITKRLARERTKMEREIRKKIEEEAETQQTEAEKLKNMTELQRAKYEAQKIQAEKDELQQRIDLNEQTAIARKELASAGINLGDDLLSMFVSPDAEKTSAAIDQLKELWPKAINEAVQQELKRKTPPAEGKQGSKSFGAEFAEKYTNSKFQNGGNQ